MGFFHKLFSLLIISQVFTFCNMDAKVKYSNKVQNLGISENELRSLIAFIDKSTDANARYYPKEQTGLTHTIEYDPVTKNYFIVFDGDNVYIDSGMKKVVTKALLYNKKKIKVVARADQTIEMGKELKLTKLLRNSPGLFKTVGICQHEEEGEQHYTIYSKLYIPGSLQQLFKGNFRLTLREKVKISVGIVKGLKYLHKKGIVHRDLGIKNYLVHIKQGKPGKRKIKGRIADFGRTTNVKDINLSERLQGNTTYVSPEGHYPESLSEKDYYKIDVFAVGCVFYRLFYGKKASWQDRSYVKDSRPRNARYREHSERIAKATASRRASLSKMKKRTSKMDFEYAILRMLDTAPKKRITAQQAYKAIKGVQKRLKGGSHGN